MVGCLSLALKFSMPTGFCRSFPREWWSAARCPSGGASFPFNSAARCALAARSRRSAKCFEFVTGTVWFHQRELRVVQGVFGAWWCRLPKSGRSVVCCTGFLCKRTKDPPSTSITLLAPGCRPLQGGSFVLRISRNKPKLVLGQSYMEFFPRLAPSSCHSGWRPCGAELS